MAPEEESKENVPMEDRQGSGELNPDADGGKTEDDELQESETNSIPASNEIASRDEEEVVHLADENEINAGGKSEDGTDENGWDAVDEKPDKQQDSDMENQASDDSEPESDTPQLDGWDALEDMVQKELHAVEAQLEEDPEGEKKPETGEESEPAVSENPQVEEEITTDGGSASAPSEGASQPAQTDDQVAEGLGEEKQPRLKFNKKIALWGFVFIVVSVGLFLVNLFHTAGEFKTLKPHFAGEFRQVSSIIGAEDMALEHRTGLVFISSDDRRSVMEGNPKQGAIFLLNLNSPSHRLFNLTRDFGNEFHPHGISLVTNAIGRKRLFVVNHRHDGQFIEVFDYENDLLQHVRSISGALLNSPNDVVGVDFERFYVTNDHGNRSAFGRKLEDYLRLSRANVLFYDGQNFSVAAGGIKYANGINVSRDGQYIYVAATTDGKILVYSREEGSGSLMFRYDIDLHSGVDNIDVDPQGNLWVAAHPKLLTFVAHSKNPKLLSPSQVFHIVFTGVSSYEVNEVLLDDGSHLSGSSVAVKHKNNLFVGSVFDDHVLVCLLPDNFEITN